MFAIIPIIEQRVDDCDEKLFYESVAKEISAIFTRHPSLKRFRYITDLKLI